MKFGSYFAAENIFQATLPFHYLAKFFGLASYKLTKWGCDINSPLIDLIILAVSISIWSAFAILRTVGWSVNGADTKHFKGSDFLNRIYSAAFLMQSIMAVFIFIFNHVRRGHIKTMFQCFHEFDQKVKKERWMFEVKVSRFYFASVSIFIFIFLVLTFLLKLFGVYTFFEISAFAYINIIFVIVSGQFTLAVVAAIKRMNVLLSNVR